MVQIISGSGTGFTKFHTPVCNNAAVQKPTTVGTCKIRRLKMYLACISMFKFLMSNASLDSTNFHLKIVSFTIYFLNLCVLALMCFLFIFHLPWLSVFLAMTSLRPYLHQSLTSPVPQSGISQCWCQQTPTTPLRSQTGCRSMPEHLLSEFTHMNTYLDACTLMSWVNWSFQKPL